MKPRILLTIIVTILLTACQNNNLDVDITKVITEPVHGFRLEEDMFALSPENCSERTNKIKSSYGTFYEHYIMNLLKINGTSDSLYKEKVLSFIADKDIKGSYQSVKKVYSKEVYDEFIPQINNCVKRFRYHFPNRKQPSRFVTCMSGWNYAFAYTDSTLVTALDMYLGDTCVYYQMLQLPQYRTHFMNKNYLLSDLMRGWMITEFDNANPTNTLLYHTIFYGKIYYAVNALLPDIKDSTLMCYTGNQMKYCKEYEKKLWGYFAEKNRLYENNMKTIQELTSDGPFTGAISKECPPRIAMWVGLQIIRSYMKNNEGATLDQLMNETDAQKILSKSKYRP